MISIFVDAKVSTCERMSSVCRFYGSITALPAALPWHKTFILFLADIFTVSQFFNHEKKKKKGSRAFAFIAENGIKVWWKRASVVFRGLDERIRRMDVGRLVRIYPSIHPQRNSERYGGYIFQFLSRRVVQKPTRKRGVGELHVEQDGNDVKRICAVDDDIELTE